MDKPMQSRTERYESEYQEFDSPLTRQMRREAYGEDIGQHSWCTTDEVRADILRLKLSPSSHLIDLGSGPCGVLTFVLATVGCRGTGVELSRSAIQVGQARAATLGVSGLLTLQEADLNEPLPLPAASFEAAMSVDVVLHLRDRLALFQEVLRVLRPGSRFAFTDAGVVTGPISNEEFSIRSARGYTCFVPAGWNERLLESAGFRLIETENRTGSVLKLAIGRLTALRNHRAEFERLAGTADFERQQKYYETIAALSRSGALSRVMYLAERHAAA